MIKAAKKLKKLWPRKKRKKRPFPDSFYHLPPPPPPQFHCCCSHHSHSNSPIQPSAPPLPPWLETAEQIHQTFPELEYQYDTDELRCEEIVVETNQHPPLLLSYQQYTVSDPVYGVPFVVGHLSPTRERGAAFFGCFVKLGVVLIRCFCPCFHVRQVD